jgi:ribosomal protein S18 acetylase RimI-like enzyme
VTAPVQLPDLPDQWPIDPIDAIESAQTALFRATESIDGVEAVIDPDVAYGSTGAPFIPFNSVIGARFSDAGADERIDAILAWFRDRSMPVGWWLGPRDRPADLEARLLARGLRVDDEGVPAMARRIDPGESLPDDRSDGVTVEPVRDLETFREQTEVIGAAFGAPPWLADQMLKFAALGFDPANPVQNYVARLDGRPVGGSLGLVAGSVLGVYNVAVVPAARGRGIGRAVTLAALREGAARGCLLAVLESTEMGYSLYVRLGFRTAATYRVLARLDWS